MKKFIPLFALLLVSMMASAQDKAERIKDIRKAYAEAKKDIDDNGKNGNPRMDLRISVSDGTEVSNDFIINEDTEVTFFFKRMRLTVETDLFDPHCYFMIEKCGANGHSRYRELLFDAISGHLIFSFLKSESHAGFVTESRYYYDDLGNIIEEKHKAGGEETGGAGSLYSYGGDQTLAMRYKAMFDALMEQKGATADRYVTTPSADKAARLKQIRSVYAEAKQKIDKDSKSAIPRHILIDIHDQEDPDMPPQTDVVNIWFEPVQNGEETTRRCYFMSSTTDLGDHHVYSEYLIDTKTSELMFCFSQQAQNDAPSLEWRYYFEKDKCIEVKGLADRNGPGFADRKAARFYLDLFNGLVNQEY